MSSHREAPEISKDPVADSTDLYAFVNPDKSDKVTLIANYIPLQAPDGGPNFYEFGDDVLYEIHVDNDGDAQADITFRFRFTSVQQPEHVLVQHRPDHVSRFAELEPSSVLFGDGRGRSWQLEEIASNLPCPPCNIGPLSTHGYAALAKPRSTTWVAGCGFSRGARRGLLRRPRGDLRPR